MGIPCERRCNAGRFQTCPYVSRPLRGAMGREMYAFNWLPGLWQIRYLDRGWAALVGAPGRPVVGPSPCPDHEGVIRASPACDGVMRAGLKPAPTSLPPSLCERGEGVNIAALRRYWTGTLPEASRRPRCQTVGPVGGRNSR